MQTDKLQPYFHLLQAIYWGLINGVTSLSEVAAWADSVILAETEPDYFFIELSLSNSREVTLQIISNAIVTDPDIISARAVIGFIHHKYHVGVLDNKKAIDVLTNLNYEDILSSYESSSIYELGDLQDYHPEDYGLVAESLIEFIDNYHSFSIENYTEWLAVNELVEASVTKHEASIIAYQNEWNIQQQQARESRQKKAKLKRLLICYMVYGAAILFSLVLIMNNRDVSRGVPLSKFKTDLFQLAIMYMALFVSYHIVWGAKWILNKLLR